MVTQIDNEHSHDSDIMKENVKKRVKLAVENSVNHNSVPRKVFKDLSNALLVDESLSAGCSYLPSMRTFGKASAKFQ